ncbi:MipA/OmpV family protein [Brenneria tiliae]|uniref:MipA/OmpV family protein n=1 Tax=Brenneria tiliae TaxID=2914984 RepID=A0ABT0MS13_9GAMM|nr:MipA/OmpV family protein [Brenneria tiliae]
MKHAFRHLCSRGIFLVLAFCHSALLHAAAEPVSGLAASDSGFIWLSDTPNETKWGLGGGVSYQKPPYKGYGSEVSPFPLVYFENKWLSLYGNNLDVKVGNWGNVELALHGEYALGEGYEESDADILDGMQKRRGGFWGGPSVAWRTDFGTLYANYLTAGNKGQRALIGFTKQFDYGKVTLAPYARAAWLNGKYVEYYYGVRDAEARPGRRAYEGESTYNLSAGVRIGYTLTEHQRLHLDAGVTRLGSGIKDSPLVDSSTVPKVTLGYLYQF